MQNKPCIIEIVIRLHRKEHTMADSLGHHLLIDFYNCLFEAINDSTIIHGELTSALSNNNVVIEEFSYHEINGEISVCAISAKCHIFLHAYPEIGYVAVDIYSFQTDVPDTHIMKDLKRAFGAQRTKATSVRRADFGSVADMKPRRMSSLTPRGRVRQASAKIKTTGAKIKTTGAKIKTTGTKIKTTGAKVMRIIARKSKV